MRGWIFSRENVRNLGIEMIEVIEVIEIIGDVVIGYIGWLSYPGGR